MTIILPPANSLIDTSGGYALIIKMPNGKSFTCDLIINIVFQDSASKEYMASLSCKVRYGAESNLTDYSEVRSLTDFNGLKYHWDDNSSSVELLWKLDEEVTTNIQWGDDICPMDSYDYFYLTIYKPDGSGQLLGYVGIPIYVTVLAAVNFYLPDGYRTRIDYEHKASRWLRNN